MPLFFEDVGTNPLGLGVVAFFVDRLYGYYMEPTLNPLFTPLTLLWYFSRLFLA